MYRSVSEMTEELVLFALHGSRTFLLCMESYFFALYGSRTFRSVWKSYFFALYGSRTFSLCIEIVRFCSL